MWGQSMNPINRILPKSITVIRGQSTGALQLFDGNTQSGWFPGWNAGDYPVLAKIKFTEKVKINKLKLFDWVGQSTFSIINQSDTITVKLNQFNKWQTKTFKTMEVDEILISISDIQGDIPITELEFYFDENIKPPSSKKLTGDALSIGTNGFHWIPTDLIPCQNIRIYQMVQWSWTPKGLAVNPTVQADGMYDEYYQELKNKNITAIPCINKVPNWSHESPNDSEWADLKMNDVGTDPNDPMSYRSISQYGFQLAARYGRVKYPSQDLKVNQEPRWNGDVVNLLQSGLDLLNYIELENEPDRPWKDTKHKYTAEEFAAFMSAVYDGHEGRLGKGYGIKAADPSMKVVMAGISAINTKYIEDMNRWFKENRSDGIFAADVINVHHYCNSANPPYPAQTVNLYLGDGIDPITDKLFERLNDLTLPINNNLNSISSLPNSQSLNSLTDNVKLWLSEFGYDTNPCSTPLCQAVENDSIQAEWILQSFLIAIKTGYEKSFVYNLSDEPDLLNTDPLGNINKNGYVFGSSGLLTNELEPKLSHQKIQWLVNLLNDKQFIGETKEGWMVFTKGLVIRVSPKVEIMKIKRGKYYLISRKIGKKTSKS